MDTQEKQQVVHIHGGMTFNSYEDFLRVFHELDADITYPQDQSRWAKNYYQYLDKESFQVIYPQMPSKNNAKYSEWKIYFEKIIPLLHDGVILVGHSLGGTFLAKYLSENILPVQIKQLHIVAGVYDYEDEWEQLGDFKFTDFPGKLIEQQIPHIYLYHSHDDDIVPFHEVEKFQKVLPDAQLHEYTDQGHFLGTTFPELFENITSY